MGHLQFGDVAHVRGRRNFLTRTVLLDSEDYGAGVAMWPERFIEDPLVRMAAALVAPSSTRVAVAPPSTAAVIDRCSQLAQGTPDGEAAIAGRGGVPIHVVLSSESSLWAPIESRWIAEFPDETNAALGTVSDEEYAALAAAVDELWSRAPVLARAVLLHVHAIAVFDSPRTVGSCTAFSLPGVVLINRVVLRDPLKLADLLYHEAVHCKYYDIMTVAALLKEGASRRYVAPPWHADKAAEKDRLWVVERALGAFHVYVHYAALDSMTDLGSERWRGSARERAQALAELLATETAFFTREGSEFLAWGLAVLGLEPGHEATGESAKGLRQTAAADGRPTAVRSARDVRLYGLEPLGYFLVRRDRSAALQRLDAASWAMLTRIRWEEQHEPGAAVAVPAGHARAIRALTNAGYLEAV
ncbi:hypothetical protein BG844_17610 [Couchioplanes caeruleus subsp. caeruleus]|uniref:HEXXH motif-containing protein n=2 Tax=Couchioplanes caeruleus TaxID=56438 RepID=A0A1K0GL18_9ACTN|nr:hypothetical protein BG844_17610 [Couchioplanes caeruleus subsp. caeruleus]